MVVLDVMTLVLPLTSLLELAAPSRKRLTFVSFLISVFFPVTGSTEYMVDVYNGNILEHILEPKIISARPDVFALESVVRKDELTVVTVRVTFVGMFRTWVTWELLLL